MTAGSVRKLFGALVTAVLLYLMLVTFVIVPALNGLAPRVFQQQTGRALQFGNITINPFTLSIAIDRVRNINPDGSLFFSADEMRADVAVRSLWSEVTLDALDLHGVQVHIAQTGADRYNFSDILDYRRAHAAPSDTAADTGATPPITIRRLHFDSAELSLRTTLQDAPASVRLHDIALDIDELTTREPASTPSSKLPALALRRLQLTLARGDAEIARAERPFATALTNLQMGLELFSTRETEAQPFTVAVTDESGGRVRATGQLSPAAAQARGEFAIADLSLLAAARYLAPQLHVELEKGSLAAEGAFDVDWQQALRYRATLKHTALRDVHLRARDDEATRIDLATLTLQQMQIDSDKRALSIDSASMNGLHVRGWNEGERISLLDALRMDSDDEEETSAPWNFALRRFALDNSRVDWRTDAVDVDNLTIAPLQVHAENIRWPAQDTSRVALAATINEATTLQAGGTLALGDRSGTLQGEIKGLPLAWGNRYLAREITASIARGALDSRWTLTLANGAPQRFTADGSVDNFQLLRQSNNTQLAAWQRLQWQQLHADLAQRRVAIARIDLQKPETRFRINADGTNNFQELIVREPPPAKVRSAAAPARGEDAEKPWQAAIAVVHLDKGELDFRDNSLPRQFHAFIGNFTGDISNLSTAPEEVAKVDLRGTVDDYAPVSLTGTVAPLRTVPALNLTLDFTNLDLATFTSYSSKYAGYTIRRGLLTVQLAYALEGDRLQGRNRIVATRLELGEKVESTRAVDLPLKLAIALLTDENGVIDMSVDVAGNLDDPQFSIGSIIWGAVRNVIVKAVTSPFRLLASLVDGVSEEQLGQVDFEPGTDHLVPAAREHLGKVTQALAKRPALELRVIGHADPVADATAMKQGKLDYFLEQEGVGEEDFRTRNRTWEKAVEKLYEQTFAEQKIGEQTPEQLALALRDNMTLGDDAMDFIAGRRALAVKRILVVELGLAPDRVLIDAVPARQDNNRRTQAELKVDS